MSKNENNSGALMGIIIFLLLLIVGGAAFYFGQNTNNKNTGKTTNGNTPSVKEIPKVTIISDTRCGAKCDTTSLVLDLKKIPNLATAEMNQIDFAEQGAKDILKAAGITKLPAAIFSNNSTTELANFLKPTSDFKYSLELGSTYNPFVKRSDRGFRLVDTKTIEGLKADSYIKGEQNAKIFWLEYTDLNCHYCKKMEKDGTVKTVMAKFPKDLNKATSNFIGVGGQKSQIGSEVLECIGKVSGADKYNSLFSKILIDGNSSQNNILKIAKEEGVNIDSVEKCINTGNIRNIVAKKFEAGKKIFSISGTPGNVLINTETGEYEILSGAYPAADFEKTISRLLK